MAQGSEQRRRTALRAIGILAVLLGLLGVTIPREAHASPDRPSPLAQTGSVLFLPLVFSNQPELESGLEVTQSVQQPDNSVQLVAGRSTFVRYTVASGAADTDVSAFLSGARGGVALPGSPLAALNNPRTLEASPDRTVLGDTFNFDLPDSWTSGTIVLQGSASNGGSFTTLGAQEAVSFLGNIPLGVTVVPIAYTCTSGGSGTITPSGPFDYLDDWPYKLYPVPAVDLGTHGAVSYSGPCTNNLPTPVYSTTGTNDWSQMLNLVRSVWISEGSPNRYYYGLVNIDCGGSCVSGIGWVGGWKAAVGWNGWNASHTGASETTAHEIGHNHGLPHAPGCGAGSPDPYYPYAGGLIGDGANANFGFDVTNYSIKPYGSTYDFMTYCSNVWVSDYNYAKLYAWEQAQPSVASLPESQERAVGLGLCKRGRIGRDYARLSPRPAPVASGCRGSHARAPGGGRPGSGCVSVSGIHCSGGQAGRRRVLRAAGLPAGCSLSAGDCRSESDESGEGVGRAGGARCVHGDGVGAKVGAH